jgi:hypothetical protein
VLAAALFLTAIPTAWATTGQSPRNDTIASPTPEKEKEHKDRLTPTATIVWTATPTPTITATTIPMVLPETGRPSNSGGGSVLFVLGALLLCAGSGLAIRLHRRGSPPEA